MLEHTISFEDIINGDAIERLSDRDPNTGSFATLKSDRPPAQNKNMLMIELKNMQTVHEIGKPLCGCLKLNLTECFESIRKITLNVTSQCRIIFRKRHSEKEDAAKVLDVDYTIAEFDDEKLEVGMYEYPFQIDLPEQVSHSVVLAS